MAKITIFNREYCTSSSSAHFPASHVSLPEGILKITSHEKGEWGCNTNPQQKVIFLKGSQFWTKIMVSWPNSSSHHSETARRRRRWGAYSALGVSSNRRAKTWRFSPEFLWSHRINVNAWSLSQNWSVFKRILSRHFKTSRLLYELNNDRLCWFRSPVCWSAFQGGLVKFEAYEQGRMTAGFITEEKVCF